MKIKNSMRRCQRTIHTESRTRCPSQQADVRFRTLA